MANQGGAEVVFLGTGSSTPTRERWLPSMLARVRGEFLLLDAGEGVQYRVLTAGLKVNRLEAILISHLHGDHLHGLPGLLESLDVWGRRRPLPILGPQGLAEYVECSLRYKKLSYDVRVLEVKPGTILSRPSYEVKAVPVSHGVEAYSFIIVESELPGKFNEGRAEELRVPWGPERRKLLMGHPITLSSGRVVYPEEVVGRPRRGLRVVYSGDTEPCDLLVGASLHADLLIHEATFSSEHSLEARESHHSTAREAAEVAARAAAKVLVLFHFSARYPNLSPLLAEAQLAFRCTYLATDLMKVSLKKWGSEWLVLKFSHVFES